MGRPRIVAWAAASREARMDQGFIYANTHTDSGFQRKLTASACRRQYNRRLLSASSTPLSPAATTSAKRSTTNRAKTGSTRGGRSREAGLNERSDEHRGPGSPGRAHFYVVLIALLHRLLSSTGSFLRRC